MSFSKLARADIGTPKINDESTLDSGIVCTTSTDDEDNVENRFISSTSALVAEE